MTREKNRFDETTSQKIDFSLNASLFPNLWNAVNVRTTKDVQTSLRSTFVWRVSSTVCVWPEAVFSMTVEIFIVRCWSFVVWPCCVLGFFLLERSAAQLCLLTKTISVLWKALCLLWQTPTSNTELEPPHMKAFSLESLLCRLTCELDFFIQLENKTPLITYLSLAGKSFHNHLIQFLQTLNS